MERELLSLSTLVSNKKNKISVYVSSSNDEIYELEKVKIKLEDLVNNTYLQDNIVKSLHFILEWGILD